MFPGAATKACIQVDVLKDTAISVSLKEVLPPTCTHLVSPSALSCFNVCLCLTAALLSVLPTSDKWFWHKDQYGIWYIEIMNSFKSS